MESIVKEIEWEQLIPMNGQHWRITKVRLEGCYNGWTYISRSGSEASVILGEKIKYEGSISKTKVTINNTPIFKDTECGQISFF